MTAEASALPRDVTGSPRDSGEAAAAPSRNQSDVKERQGEAVRRYQKSEAMPPFSQSP